MKIIDKMEDKPIEREFFGNNPWQCLYFTTITKKGNKLYLEHTVSIENVYSRHIGQPKVFNPIFTIKNIITLLGNREYKMITEVITHTDKKSKNKI